LFSVWKQTQLLDSKSVLHALRVNFENFGHTAKNKIFRLVKLLADLCTRLKWRMCSVVMGVSHLIKLTTVTIRWT